MSGPRIYTESWERLKTAAREMEEREEREAENANDGKKHAAKPRRAVAPQTSRAFVVATLVLSALSVLLGILWFDAQSRLIHASRETNDLKAQLDLIQDRFKTMDKDRERIEDENAALRRQEEETRAEAVARERDMEMLKAQTERVGMKPKPSATRTEVPAVLPQTQSKPLDQVVPAARIQEKPPLPTLEKAEQQDVRTFSIR